MEEADGDVGAVLEVGADLGGRGEDPRLDGLGRAVALGVGDEDQRAGRRDLRPGGQEGRQLVGVRAPGGQREHARAGLVEDRVQRGARCVRGGRAATACSRAAYAAATASQE